MWIEIVGALLGYRCDNIMESNIENPNYVFPKILQVTMKKKGISFKELSKKSGVKKSTLYGWTSGIRPRDIIHVYKVAKILNLTIEELMFGTKNTPQNLSYELVLYRITSDKIREKMVSLTETDGHLTIGKTEAIKRQNR